MINFSHYLNLLTYCMWQTFPSCSCDLGPSNLGSYPSSLKPAILSSSPLPLLPLSSYLNLLICKLHDGQRRAQHIRVLLNPSSLDLIIFIDKLHLRL